MCTVDPSNQSKLINTILSRSKILIARHDYLIQEPGRPVSYTTKNGLDPSKPLLYLSLPYPDYVNNVISSIPSRGFQELARQYHGLSLEMIAYMAGAVGWTDQVRSNLSASSETYDNTPSPMYAVLTELWRILERLDVKTAPLERSICISHYIQLMSMIYRKIVQSSPIFQSLRNEATDIMHNYGPRSQAERENLIYNSMNVVQAWKTGSILEPEGVRLLNALKHRFPEMRQWDTLMVILQKFPGIPQTSAEWKENLMQNSSRG